MVETHDKWHNCFACDCFWSVCKLMWSDHLTEFIAYRKRRESGTVLDGAAAASTLIKISLVLADASSSAWPISIFDSNSSTCLSSNSRHFPTTHFSAAIHIDQPASSIFTLGRSRLATNWRECKRRIVLLSLLQSSLTTSRNWNGRGVCLGTDWENFDLLHLKAILPRENLATGKSCIVRVAMSKVCVTIGALIAITCHIKVITASKYWTIWRLTLDRILRLREQEDLRFSVTWILQTEKKTLTCVVCFVCVARIPCKWCETSKYISSRR
jgi:hypothetical protein